VLLSVEVTRRTMERQPQFGEDAEELESLQRAIYGT
jgi:hypothetical protein